MIVSLLPAFFGPRPAASETHATASKPDAGAPAEAPGFGATLLAMLGLNASAPASVDAGPDGSLDGSSDGALDGAATTTEGGDEIGAGATAVDALDAPGGTEHGGDVEGEAVGVGARVASEGAPRPLREGSTSPAGWAALATGPRSSETFHDGMDASVELHVRTVRAHVLDARPQGTAPAPLPGGISGVATSGAHHPSREERGEPEGGVDSSGDSPDRALRPAPTTGGPPAPGLTVTVAAATAAPASAVVAADRSLDRLDPELRTRVERVVERMAEEHGVAVSVVEGYRSPERQEHLYAQGRTRPGPVVTWTRESRHSEGRAADLRVDGPWSQPEAYAKLQRVAREEGLGTLGMKDPGHVELSESGDASPDGEPIAARARPVSSATGALRPVAGVARVAHVASVARVARVAVPGERSPVAGVGALPASAADAARSATLEASARRASRTEAPPAPGQELPGDADVLATRRSGAEPSAPRVDGRFAPAATVAADAAERPRRSSSDERGRTEGTRAVPRAEGSGYAHADAGTASPTRAAAPVGAATGIDRAAAVERVLEVQDALEALGPGQRLSLRMDGTAGPVDRVRVGLADNALSAELELDDPVLAAKLRGDAGELFRALEKQGYDPQSLTLRMAGRAHDATPEAWGAAMRSETAADALRSLFGTETQNQGRDPQARRDGAAGERARDEGSNRSRRENQKEDR